MNKETTKTMSIFTRTPLHVGAGNSVGAVDSPVMRERHTRIPIVPGSSLKGVLRDLFNGEEKAAARYELFGHDQDEKDKEKQHVGALLIGEGRVVAFPVRSAKNGFAWLTCPLALDRFKRDAGRDYTVPTVADDSACLAPNALRLKDDAVVLEEYRCDAKGEPDEKIVAALKGLSADAVWQSLGDRLCIVSDELFCYFAEHACEVVTRIRVDDETGTVAGGALFNQEQVPSETMFYAVIGAQSFQGAEKEKEALAQLTTRLTETGGILQIGGDETIGLGYCSVEVK